MGGPWEKYADTAPKKPWEAYAATGTPSYDNRVTDRSEIERKRREFVQGTGELETRVKDVANQAFNPNVQIPAADGVGDFMGRVLPQSITQLGPKMVKGVYEGIKGQTDPLVRSLSSLQPQGLPGPQMERNAGQTVRGLAEAMTAPTGLMGADRAKEAWLTDPAGSALAVAPTLKALGSGVKALPKPKGSTLEGVIDTGINKGIRPGIEGNRTFAQSTQYHKRAQQAVKTIIDNHAQGALKLTDEFGEVQPGLPKNLRQFSQAIDQSKRNVYEQYNQMAVQSGEAGAVVDLSPIPAELMTVANNRALQKAAPDVAAYARKRAEAFSGGNAVTDGVTSRRANTFTAQEAQEAIAMYNRVWEAFNKNPSYDTASRAYIDSLVVNNLRKGLDASIEKATGPGYQALKNQYGALKTIEKDVSRRAIVDARKNPKGLLDFSDVFSGGQVVSGLISMNPATVGTGIASKVIANFYKRLNDPNKIVGKMFDRAGKMYTPKQRAEMQAPTPQAPQSVVNPMAGKVNTGGITQPGPVVRRSDMGVNQGGIVQPGPVVQRMAGINSGNLDAPARNQSSFNLLKSASVTAKQPVSTWREFVGSKMSQYMKEEGSHGAAMKRLGKEWKERN